ncbi:MAG: insulinase family protein, partial [Alistipes sp.]
MKQPALIIPDSVDILLPAKRTLANGIDCYTLASDDFEVLRITFVFRAGSAVQSTFFSASATANMLSEGSSEMTAQQIAEKLDFYGSYFDVSIDRDYAYISFCSLSKFVPQTLEVAEQIILHPTFPNDEVSTYCAKRKQGLAIERSKVETQAREAFAQALFGSSHPYGVAADEVAYDQLTRTDIVTFYEKFYTAENCFVVCSGRITGEELSAIETLVSKIPSAKHPSAPSFPVPLTQHFLFVEHADAVQSSIRVGRLLFPRLHPDFMG